MNEWAKTLVVTSSNPADFKQRITPRLPPFLESLELHSDIWTLEIASSLKLAKLYGTDFLQRSFTRSASWDRLKFFAGNLNYQEMLGRHRWSVFFLIKFRGQDFCIFHAPQSKTCFVVVLLVHQKDLHRRGFKIKQIATTKRKTRVKPGTVARKGTCCKLKSCCK